MDLIAGLELLVADQEDRPSVKAGNKTIKQRVRKSEKNSVNDNWVWGDEK